MSEIELADHFDRMSMVVSELLKGNSPTQIATATGFKRAEVIELIDEWKKVVHNDTAARERAKEAISGAEWATIGGTISTHQVQSGNYQWDYLNTSGTEWDNCRWD